MSTKDLIQAELEGLDEALLADIYLFITTFIHSKQGHQSSVETDHRTTESSEQSMIESSDPLSDFIGKITHGSLASNIDKELYD